MKKIIPIAIVLFTIILISAASVILWYKNALKSVSESSEKVVFEIQAGTPTQEILQNLEDSKLIKNKTAALIYLKFHKDKIIKAGEFEISPDMSLREILRSLSVTGEFTVWVTIPEGLRYDEIAEIWSEKLLNFNKETFNKIAESNYKNFQNAEGFLFPDTYKATKDVNEQRIFDLMTDTFETKVGEVNYDTLILASIVEREAKFTEERPIIAGILQKRLDNGWLLQADATLLYEGKNWRETITQNMKASDSPYNSYKKTGLPPTPICNPGLDSINAAKKPNTSTPYWYYLHDPQGNIHYAETEEEHIQNIWGYLY